MSFFHGISSGKESSSTPPSGRSPSLAGHGGEQRAVMVYQLDSYRYWQEQLQRDDFEYGQFGENLTVDGLPDNVVGIRRPLSNRERAVRSNPAAGHLFCLSRQ